MTKFTELQKMITKEQRKNTWTIDINDSFCCYRHVFHGRDDISIDEIAKIIQETLKAKDYKSSFIDTVSPPPNTLPKLKANDIIWYRPKGEKSHFLVKRKVQEVKGDVVALTDGFHTNYPEWVDLDRIEIVKIES